ncbi:uncharacterized protein [Primulina eburnea]|uniref:uncharacterized protein n=1 Tax=Primulina eburnea TaxID=1245227 RepID=UPI003C6C5819
MCEAAYDNYTENPEAFMEFLEEAEKPLYNGCKRYTKLSAIVKLYNTKAKHRKSDALFSDLLMDFGDMLPDNHNLPTKMYDVKKTLSCLALSHEKIHACSNDCILYRKQYKDCVNCPKCGLSRWKLTKKNIEKKAYGNLSGCTTHGYYACPVCKEDTCAKHLKNGKKMSFVGHRRFLPRFHPYRRCVFGKKISVKGKKRKNAKDNNLEDSKEEKDFGSIDFRKCWKKKFIFFNIPYWKHLHVRHCLDVMHIEKNVFESLINTLVNVKGKTKDNVAARLDMVQMGVRPELAPQFGEKRTYIPPVACSFTKKEKLQVCQSIKDIKVPEGFSSNLKNLVSLSELKLIGLKSHDCHVLMQHFLPILIRDALPKHVRYAIIRLSFFFKDICCKVLDVANSSCSRSSIMWTNVLPVDVPVRKIHEVDAEIDRCNGGTTSTLTWLAHGPRGQVIKYSSYVINDNLYQTKARYDERNCQNSGVSLVASTMLVCSAKDKNPLMTDVTFYGVIEEIWELDYHKFQVPLFKCAWVANDKGVINNDECGFTLVN